MVGLIGKKLGHTRIYDANGVITPVTMVLVGKNRVLQVKTPETDGYSAVQLGFGDQKPQRLSKGKVRVGWWHPQSPVSGAGAGG